MAARLSGRADERAALIDAVRVDSRARRGSCWSTVKRASGKTTLVRSACERPWTTERRRCGGPALRSRRHRPGGPGGPLRRRVRASRGVEDQISLWREAVAACAAAGLGWEQQVSSWRLASALIESGAPGGEAADAAPRRPRLRRPARRHTAADPRRGARRQCTHLADGATGTRLGRRTRRLHRADRAREGGARPPRGEPNERRDRRGALHQREDGERARLQPAAQDRDRVTPRGRRAGPSRGVGVSRLDTECVRRGPWPSGRRTRPGRWRRSRAATSRWRSAGRHPWGWGCPSGGTPPAARAGEPWSAGSCCVPGR